VQIKSSIHNIWGEVEHKTTYKGKLYEIEPEHKRTITDEIFNVLEASDKQLKSLFNRNYTESDLIRALFAEQTRLTVSSKLGTDYLAKYYDSFFELFCKRFDSLVRHYVSHRLTNASDCFHRMPVQITAEIDLVDSLVADLKSDYKEYYLDAIKTIAEEIIEINDMDDFLKIVADVVIDEVKKARIVDYDEGINNDSFADDPDFTYDDKPVDDNLLTAAHNRLSIALESARKGEK
jgi:hypothetical protein